MIPEKIRSIINSCTTEAQLDVCSLWIDYIYPNVGYDSSRKTALHAIKAKRKQLTATPSDWWQDVHTQD